MPLHPQPPAHNSPMCCRTQFCPPTHFACLLTVGVKRHLLHWQLPASVSIVAEINLPKSSSSKQLPQPPVHRCLQGYTREERIEQNAGQGDFSIRVHMILYRVGIWLRICSPGQAVSHPLTGALWQISLNCTSTTGVAVWDVSQSVLVWSRNQSQKIQVSLIVFPP